MPARNLPPADRLPIGSRVEIIPHQRDSSWPGGVGVIVEIKPEFGGYLVRHPSPGPNKTIDLGWCWDEVTPARPWWRRWLRRRYPRPVDVKEWRLTITWGVDPWLLTIQWGRRPGC